MIAKKKIPYKYVVKYNVNNLSRVKLANFWRKIYTLTDNDGEIIVLIVDILNHEEYNKVFGYRN